MYRIEIIDRDEDGKEVFRYVQEAEDVDVKAIFDIVNKKPRAKRADAGVRRKPVMEDM